MYLEIGIHPPTRTYLVFINVRWREIPFVVYSRHDSTALANQRLRRDIPRVPEITRAHGIEF